MKHVHILFCWCLVFTLPGVAWAQTAPLYIDSVKYKVSYYEVKSKSQTVNTVAAKLKVNPLVIQKLNKFKKPNQTLVKGQRIKIPVYPKGYKYVLPPATPAKVVTDYSMRDEEVYVDTVKEKKRILLIDASIELNEVLLEGVQVSLAELQALSDSASKSSNAKTYKERLQLKPYVEHLNDSLSYAIKALKAEKNKIVEKLKLSAPLSLTNDTVVQAGDTVIYQIATFADRPAEKKVISVKTKDELAAINKNAKKRSKGDINRIASTGKDTVIVYDMASAKPYKPLPEARHITQTSAALADSAGTTMANVTVTDTLMNTTVPQAVDTSNATGEASNALEAAKRSVPRDVLLSNADSIKRIKAEFFVKRARKAMDERNYRNAELYINKSIELSPVYYDAWLVKAEWANATGSPQQALKDLRYCESLDSSSHELYLALGNTLSALKRKPEAYAAYDKSVKLNPDNIPALMQKAAILADWKRYDEAIAGYDSVLAINRIYYFAYKARGQVKLLTKDFANATDDFTRFLIFEETDPSAFYYRGLAKIGDSELVDGCMDLSTAASMGYLAAEKAIKKSCE